MRKSFFIVPAPTDNRVLEVNTQRLRPSQALVTYLLTAGRERRIL